ncbi:EPIDERMAL PATTERNING FACTOR-like protein 5 [Coffea arabica]|uniref:Epidermal patterning factor-like protein n=1 Tax=Coffea arabica TaxID=13443 RepID=A0A6P6WKE8_COFAR|nr:EPIDERMAL PATTERNING FACTOR-like protein 5 [Coffea arabica]
MAVIRHRHCNRSLSFATISALLFLLLSSVSALTFNHARQFSGGAMTEEIRAEVKRAGGMELIKRVLYRRRLTGPGSSPPTCRSKCGSCAPCKPVHVPIQPGLSRPLEYYPEAWRCKCGNKLFLP